MGKIFRPTHYTESDLANEGFKHLGKNVRIARNCTIVGPENISIADNVRIDGYCTIVATGTGYLDLGSYIHVGGYCALLAAEGIVIEDFSCLSWGCKLFSRSDDYSGRHMTNPMVQPKYTNVSRGRIKLCRHALVGAQTVLLPKVTLGEGVAVGALSLVSKDLAAWGIYSGVPAKWIKERKRELLQLEKNLLNEISGGTTTKEIY